MGKMHKEIAKFLTQSAENEDVADEDIIKVGRFTICHIHSFKIILCKVVKKKPDIITVRVNFD